MKRKILLLTGLMLAIGAAVYVSWPKDALSRSGCNCDPLTIIDNVPVGQCPGDHSLNFLFPAPCATVSTQVQCA